MCCEPVRGAASRSALAEHFDLVKTYDPRPRNGDGSVRRFLYRWDDGKNGERRLVRCRHCGRFFLVQAYHLNKFSKFAEVLYEDWYPIGGEAEADWANEACTGPEWERTHEPALRCADDVIRI